MEYELEKGEDPSTRMYSGPYKAPYLAPFLERYALPVAASMGQEEAGVDEELDHDFPLQELKDQSCLEAYCTKTGYSLCALLLVDPYNVAEARYHMRQLQLVQYSRTKAKGMFTMSWVDQTKQMDFLDTFGVVPEDYPQLIIYAQVLFLCIPFNDFFFFLSCRSKCSLTTKC